MSLGFAGTANGGTKTTRDRKTKQETSQLTIARRGAEQGGNHWQKTLCIAFCKVIKDYSKEKTHLQRQERQSSPRAELLAAVLQVGPQVGLFGPAELVEQLQGEIVEAVGGR